MKWLTIFFCVSLILSIGCKKEDDEALIQSLLDKSGYSAPTAVTDDGTTTPKQVFTTETDSVIDSLLRFARWINRPVTREITIEITGDSALATIKAALEGTFYVRDTTLGPIYTRPIQDSFVRQVKLYKDTIWHILSITAGDFKTVDAAHPITITEVKAEVARRNYTWKLMSPTEFLTKVQLPTFEPSDTVIVTTTVSISGDSSWAFLHHGRRSDVTGTGIHIRDPFYKISTHVFRRAWVIASDNIGANELPAVRHSAVDVIGWQTLWGKANGTYYCRAWALPYIVKSPNQEVPPDEQ